MYLKLQIIFTILSAICVAVVIPIGAFFGWMYAGICALFAFLFFGLMKACKRINEPVSTNQPPSDEPSFFNPQKDQEENDK